MSSPDKLSVFDTAVVAFEIRFEQKLDSSWGHLAYETRMAIVGEGMEIDAHQWEKRHLLLKFFDDAAAAVAVVINEYFPLLLEVATVQREHLGDETPLIWTRAKILTQVCDFLGVDEKFDETSAPKDDSRVLKTAERITAGLGWRDDEAPAEFCLPWWANMSPLFSLRRLALAPHNSRPRNCDTEPLSRVDTLEWVKLKELWIHKRLERQIYDDSLDGMIKAGTTGTPTAVPSKTGAVSANILQQTTELKTKLPRKMNDFSQWMNEADLTDKQSECFSLKMEYCLSVSEIARRLEISRPVVDGHVTAAQRKIDQARGNQTLARKTAKHTQE